MNCSNALLSNALLYNLDSIKNGICDWIVSPFNYRSKSPIEPQYAEDGKTLIEGAGVGRQITLNEPLSIQTVVDICKQHFNLPHLRLGLATSHRNG